MAHHVFITGGGTGIGLATARALAPTGARFTLVGRDRRTRAKRRRGV